MGTQATGDTQSPTSEGDKLTSKDCTQAGIESPTTDLPDKRFLPARQMYCVTVIKVKVKVQVYSLVSGAKRSSLDFTQLPLVTEPVHIHKPSQLRGEYTARLPFSAHAAIQTHRPALRGTQLLLGRESARASRVPCLGAQRRSIFSAAGDRTHDLLLVLRARYN